MLQPIGVADVERIPQCLPMCKRGHLAFASYEQLGPRWQRVRSQLKHLRRLSD